MKREPRGSRHRVCVMLDDDPPGKHNNEDSDNVLNGPGYRVSGNIELTTFIRNAN